MKKSAWLRTGSLTLAATTIWACSDQDVLSPPRSSMMEGPTCFGEEATIWVGGPEPRHGSIVDNGDGTYTITGSSRNDVIVGGPGADVIDGGEGFDRICALGGDDVITGGPGRDRIDGGDGVDAIDFLASPAGVQVSLLSGRGTGGDAQQDIYLFIENVYGSEHLDILRGDAGPNVLDGRGGDDIFFGEDGDDVLIGGAGDDVMHGNTGADEYYGGDGIDRLTFGFSPAGVTVHLGNGTGLGGHAEGDTYESIEFIIGSEHADDLTGSEDNDQLHGRGGNDVVRGAGGDDIVRGDTGDDELHGGEGNDILHADGGADILYGDAGADRLFGHDDDDQLFGGDDDDDLRPGFGVNTVDGGNGNDYLDTASCRDTYINVESFKLARCEPDVADITITAGAPSLIADGAASTPLTVQLKDADGNDLTFGGADVELTTSLGILTAGAENATTVNAVDNGDGTYTATLTAGTVAGSATITGTIGGAAITDQEVVEFTSGAVHHFVVEASGGGNIAAQSINSAFDIRITAQDANNNTATGFTGTVDMAYDGDTDGSLGASGSFVDGVITQAVTVPIAGTLTIVVTNSAGTETGTSNAFDVQSAPDATNDEASGASAPGEAFHTDLNALLSIADGSAQDLLANDQLGFPAAAITSFGAIQVNDGAGTLEGAVGTVDSNAAGTTVAPLPGFADGSLTVNANGSVSFTPPTNYTGLLRFEYRLGSAAGSDVASVTLAVGDRPVAIADNYSGTHGALLGNVTLDTNTGTPFSIGANDTGDRLSYAAGAATGGSVLLNSDGTFGFTPAAGFSGAAGFSYTVSNGFGTSAAVNTSLTVSTTRVWFVNRAVASGDGTQASPFAELSSIAAVNDGGAGHPQDNDIIFIAEHSGAYTGSLTLRSGQRIFGQDAAGGTLASLASITPATHQALPTLTPGSGDSVVLTSAGTTLTLGSNNTLRGLTLGSASTAIAGSSFGTLTVGTDVVINTTGRAMALNTGTLSGNFGGVTSAGGSENISLIAVGGTSSFGSGTLSGALVDAFLVDGGAGTVSYAGSISGTARPANIQDMTGGGVTLSGAISGTGTGILISNNSGAAITLSHTSKVLSTGGNSALTFSTNPGSSLNISNGGLAITTTTGAGITASGGGTVTVSGGNNSISSGTGTALNLDGVAAGGLAFRSISANGAVNGIRLNNVTGTGLTVSGDGATATSGGTIQNTTGAAISITTAPSTSLAFMSMTNVNSGIVANTFNTLTVGSSVNVSSAGGPALNLTTGAVSGSFASVNASGSSSHGVALNGVTGTWQVSAGSVVGGANGAALSIGGNSGGGTLTWLGSLSQANAQPLISVAAHNSGTVTFGGTLSATSGTGLAFNDADGTYNFNTAAGSTSLNGGDAGIDITNGSSGTFTFGPAGTPGNFAISHSNATNQAFYVESSTPNVIYNGNLTKSGGSSGNSWLVDMFNVSGGTVTFQNGTLTANNVGQGILLNNADGAVTFIGTTTLSGAARARIGAGSTGPVTFGSGTTITNPTGTNIFGLDIENASGGNSSTNVTFAGSITSNSNRPVRITGMGSGNVSLTGNITSTGQGILVNANSGGAITFSGTTKSFNTGANAAVSLETNPNTSIGFTNGGLAITTTTGAGFFANGGGTVSVGGSTNTVSTGSGTAVTITNTTISGSGVTFRSVNSTGAASGIVLSNTSGPFTIAGNGGSCTIGTPTCTGGLINTSTGHGISLTSTGAVSLTNLRVASSGGHGIHTTGSTNLTLTSSYLQGNGNGDEENNLNILNASGSVLVNGSSFNGASENLIRVDNNNANLTFTVQGSSVFEYPNPWTSAFRNSAILITPKGSSAITASVTGNTFRNIPNYSFQAGPDASVTSTSTYTFSNNTISVDVGLNVLCSSNSQCRVGHVSAGGTGGTTNFIATGNNFNRVNGDGVFILGANQSSTLRFRVDSNTIANALDDAFVVGLGQSARVIGQFNLNNISNIGADALEVASGEPNIAFGAGSASDMDLVFTNNTMTNVGTNSSFAGSGGPLIAKFGDSDQLLCVAFTGNSVNPIPTATGITAYFDGYLGVGSGGINVGNAGSITYERAGSGNLTEAMVNADNPGLNINGIIVQGATLSNGATCQRPGI